MYMLFISISISTLAVLQHSEGTKKKKSAPATASQKGLLNFYCYKYYGSRGSSPSRLVPKGLNLTKIFMSIYLYSIVII